MSRRGLLLWVALIVLAGCDSGHRSRGVGAGGADTATTVGAGGGNGGNGNGGGGGNSPVWPPSDCDYSMADGTWRPDQNLVWYFNSQFYGDKTARWKNGVIKVTILNPAVEVDALQSIFDELNSLIHPVKLVIFDGPADKADIIIDFSANLPQNTGFSAWDVNEKNRITWALIALGVFRGEDCYFYAIVKHHLIRVLGIFNYTHDGGVMEEEFYNDMITQAVSEALTQLYDLRPGSVVGPDGPAPTRGDNHNDNEDNDN